VVPLGGALEVLTTMGAEPLGVASADDDAPVGVGESVAVVDSTGTEDVPMTTTGGGPVALGVAAGDVAAEVVASVASVLEVGTTTTGTVPEVGVASGELVGGASVEEVGDETEVVGLGAGVEADALAVEDETMTFGSLGTILRVQVLTSWIASFPVASFTGVKTITHVSVTVPREVLVV